MWGIFHKGFLLLHALKKWLDTKTSQKETCKQWNPPEADHNEGDLALILFARLLQLANIGHDDRVFDITLITIW